MVSKSIIFLVISFLGNFYRNLAIFFWSHCCWSVSPWAAAFYKTFRSLSLFPTSATAPAAFSSGSSSSSSSSVLKVEIRQRANPGLRSEVFFEWRSGSRRRWKGLTVASGLLLLQCQYTRSFQSFYWKFGFHRKRSRTSFLSAKSLIYFAPFSVTFVPLLHGPIIILFCISFVLYKIRTVKAQSVDSSAPAIMRSRVRISITPCRVFP